MTDIRYASRKFIIACVLILYGMVCNSLGMAPNPEWLSFLRWIAGLYIAGNVGMALVTKVAEAKA